MVRNLSRYEKSGRPFVVIGENVLIIETSWDCPGSEIWMAVDFFEDRPNPPYLTTEYMEREKAEIIQAMLSRMVDKNLPEVTFRVDGTLIRVTCQEDARLICDMIDNAFRV